MLLKNIRSGTLCLALLVLAAASPNSFGDTSARGVDALGVVIIDEPRPVISLPEPFGDTNIDALLSIVERRHFKYLMTYGKDTKVGELTVDVEVQENDILVTTSFRVTNALARLFLKEYIISNRFDLVGDRILLASGESRRPDSSKGYSSYVIDRERGTIQYSNQEPVSVPADSKFDTFDFPFKLATSNLESLEGSEVLVLSNRKASLYQYEALQRETITLSGQQFDALKITRNKYGEQDRHVAIWLTDDSERIPLRIESTKQSMSSTFDLIEVGNRKSSETQE